MLALKLMLPGYRSRWIRRAAVFLRAMKTVSENFSFNDGPDGPTAADRDGLVLTGFSTPRKDEELFRLLAPALPTGIDLVHFRLARDIVTRYLYPHLRPDLSPEISVDDPTDASAMVGFHGQHKDGVDGIAGLALRDAYRTAFKPSAADVIIDCGAFIGIGAAAVAPLLPDGQLIALEADARNARLLTLNTERNGLPNVKALNRAIWKTHGETLDLATGEAQANTLRNDVYDGGGRQQVETASIDGLVAEFGLQRVDMLSLTVNGAEVEALEGAEATLSGHRPRVRLAGWYQRDGQNVAALCRPLLEKAGYHVHVGPKLGVLALPSERVAG